MKNLSWITNRHVVSALCAAPILFSCAYASAAEVAADAGTPPVADHLAREHVAASETAPAYTLTFNLGLYSAYMFRGVDYSDGPAVQGGIDWAHSSGFYLGTWFSNLDPYSFGKIDADPANDIASRKGNHLETDFYGGYAHTFANGLGINLLGNYYKYFEGRDQIGTNNKQDTFEASIALSYSYFTYTYYRVLTDYYGTNNRNGSKDDTKGADYNELKFNYKLPVGDINFMTKVGYQNTRHLDGDQADFAIGLNRDFSLPSGGKPIGGFNAGGYYTNTFAVKNEAYYVSNEGRDLNEDKIWFYVKRTW